MRQILDDLLRKEQELQNQLDGLTFEPEYNNADALFTAYKQYLALQESLARDLEILADLKVILTAAIEQAERKQDEERRVAEIKRLDQEIGDLVNTVSQMAPGPDQSMILEQITCLLEKKEVLANG